MTPRRGIPGAAGRAGCSRPGARAPHQPRGHREYRIPGILRQRVGMCRRLAVPFPNLVLALTRHVIDLGGSPLGPSWQSPSRKRSSPTCRRCITPMAPYASMDGRAAMSSTPASPRLAARCRSPGRRKAPSPASFPAATPARISTRRPDASTEQDQPAGRWRMAPATAVRRHALITPNGHVLTARPRRAQRTVP
jgi:hypothetical protein